MKIYYNKTISYNAFQASLQLQILFLLIECCVVETVTLSIYWFKSSCFLLSSKRGQVPLYWR